MTAGMPARKAKNQTGDEEVKPAAHRPQKLLAASEQREFTRRKQARSDQFMCVLHSIDVLRYPEERVEITQTALAFLDVGLDEIARRARAPHALLAFGELGGDEFRRGLRHDLLVEARLQSLEELLVSRDEPRLDEGRPHRHVAAGLLQAFVDRSRRMADFLLEVPQHVEQGLDDLFDCGRRLVGQQEQEIDIGPRRQDAAPVPADSDDGRQRCVRRRWGEPTGRHFQRDAEQIVDLGAQRLCARPSRAAGFQRLSRLVAPGCERSLKGCDRRTAERRRILRMPLVERGELLEKPGAIEALA